MKRTQFILLLVLFGFAASLFTTSCRQSYTVIPTSELTNSAPFQAKVEKIYVESFEQSGTVAFASLKKDDGRRVSIGGENASAEMIGFVKSLQKGQIYTFPDVFLAYQKTHEKKK